MKALLGGALAVTMMAGAASAAIVTFDTPGANTTSLDFVLDGVDGTVTPGVSPVSVFGIKLPQTPYVTQSADGLGVWTDRTILDDTDTDIDGQFGYEWLTFVFDVPVLLGLLTLADVDDDDDWNIYVNGSASAIAGDTSTYDFGSIYVSTFTIAAQNGDEDSFRVLSIETVPLPASALLLLGGLGGIAAMRRRKKAA